jgi:hypothetical protein
MRTVRESFGRVKWTRKCSGFASRHVNERGFHERGDDHPVIGPVLGSVSFLKGGGAGVEGGNGLTRGAGLAAAGGAIAAFGAISPLEATSCRKTRAGAASAVAAGEALRPGACRARGWRVARERLKRFGDEEAFQARSLLALATEAVSGPALLRRPGTGGSIRVVVRLVSTSLLVDAITIISRGGTVAIVCLLVRVCAP